jgi:hypothetical protein
MSSLRHPRAAAYYAIAVLAPAALLIATALFIPGVRRSIGGLMALIGPPKTVQSRLDEFGPRHRSDWSARCAARGVPYPPATVVLLAIKDERVIHVHAGAPGSAPVYVDSIPVVAASGGPGPKLREGDMQVPEGVYPIESLNPNSRFHVSLRIGYPNDFDRAMAARDGRTRDRVPLGGDIMIHGSDLSVGCLAVGDDAAERLFTLTADTGLGNIRVVIVPTNLAADPAPAPGLPDWVPELYRALDAELARLEPAPEGAP